MMSLPHCVYAVDVGSIYKVKFAWARAAPDEAPAVQSGRKIGDLVDRLIADLAVGRRLALGFECPLFVPTRDEATRLTAGRPGDGRYAWSAGPGAGALVTGLAQSAYVLRQLAGARGDRGLRVGVTLEPERFLSGEGNLLIWEAFVAGAAKTGSDTGDAELAAKVCLERFASGNPKGDVVPDGPVFSIIGAVLLHSKLTDDIRLLSQPCLVVKPRRVASQSHLRIHATAGRTSDLSRDS